MEVDTFDVVIIGGGLAGCSTALSLLRNATGVSCLIIDDTNPSSFKIGESLPPESGRLLHYLHPSLPKKLSSQVELGLHTTCTGNASAWSSSLLEERHAIFNPFGHGLHLNRAGFEELLRDTVTKCALESNSRVILQKASFKSIQKDAAGIWAVEVEANGKRKNVTAKWVVDGTGRKASVASKIGIKSVSSDPLLAFYAVFIAPEFDGHPGAGDNDRRTLIEATADGWWYTSLISHKPPTRIVVFHTLPTHSAAKPSRRAEGFLERLHDTTTHISSIISQWDYAIQGGFPRCTAAGSSHLEKTCDAGERWVAVGDAALAFDPLSSQGMMTALEMGIYVGLKLSQHMENKTTDEEFEQDVSDAYRGVRQEYEKHRAYYYSVVKRFQGEVFWDNVEPWNETGHRGQQEFRG